MEPKSEAAWAHRLRQHGHKHLQAGLGRMCVNCMGQCLSINHTANPSCCLLVSWRQCETKLLAGHIYTYSDTHSCSCEAGSEPAPPEQWYVTVCVHVSG
jgi:hypothetical protein